MATDASIPQAVDGCKRVLVACEYSATVRDAFIRRGHKAWSCDLLPTEGDPTWHIQDDVFHVLSKDPWWDIIILHVPCTAMAVCGNRTYAEGAAGHIDRLRAIEWTLGLWDAATAAAPMVALENGASVIFPVLRRERKADVQYIHPWQHGHPEQKKTGFALRGLPRLKPTKIVYDEMMQLPRKERERIHFMSPSADRGKERARFFQGFADAMADQWGSL